jgi:ANTAR domain
MDDNNKEMQEQIESLRERMDSSRASIDENRADIDQLHKTGQVDRSDIDELQVGGEVDRHLIVELQAEGVLRAEHAADMEAALRSARVIGAAIGIVMASRRCTAEQAFQILAKVSQDSNQKLREIADAVVLTGGLPST